MVILIAFSPLHVSNSLFTYNIRKPFLFRFVDRVPEHRKVYHKHAYCVIFDTVTKEKYILSAAIISVCNSRVYGCMLVPFLWCSPQNTLKTVHSICSVNQKDCNIRKEGGEHERLALNLKWWGPLLVTFHMIFFWVGNTTKALYFSTQNCL